MKRTVAYKAVLIITMFLLTFFFSGKRLSLYADDRAPSPQLSGRTSTSITLKEEAGCQYRKDEGAWQDSNVFTGLSRDTYYTFQLRPTDAADENRWSDMAMFSTTEHDHDWTFSASGAVITAVCENNDGGHKGSTSYTLTLKAPERKTYGDTGSNQASIEGSIESIPNPRIIYKKNGNALQAAPSDAGTYTAEISILNARASLQYTIERRAVTVTADSTSKEKGEADPQSFSATVTGTVGNLGVSYTVSRAPGEDPGIYVITPAGEEVQGNGNYSVTYKTGIFTIFDPEGSDEDDDDDDEDDDDDDNPLPLPQPDPPKPQPEPAPEPEPVWVDPVIPAPDLGVSIPEIFSILRKAGVEKSVSTNQIVLYAPRESISFNGRSHVKKGSGSSKRKVDDLDISVNRIPAGLREVYHYKNNKKASAGASYYISLKVDKGSEDYRSLSSSEKTALRKAVKRANKELKSERVYFTINMLDLSGFEFDRTVSKKSSLVFRRKSDPRDTLTVRKEDAHKIEDLVIKPKKKACIRAYLSGYSFKLSKSEYERSISGGTVTITGNGKNLTGSSSGSLLPPG